MDIAVVYGGDEELYLAYECKWLEKQSQESTLIKRYLGDDGIGRFLSGKYASNMPVGFMVGYVASGNLPQATSRIHQIMQRNGMPSHFDSRRIQPLQAFTTEHERYCSSLAIRITHIFLPF